MFLYEVIPFSLRPLYVPSLFLEKITPLTIFKFLLSFLSKYIKFLLGEIKRYLPFIDEKLFS